MAQTTGGMSPQNMYVGFSTDGSSWTEVTGSANSVEVSGGERESGSARTFGTTTPITKYGGKAPLTVTVRGVYSEDADEAFRLAQAAYDGDTAFYVRWSPGGGDAGDYGYTTGAGQVMSPLAGYDPTAQAAYYSDAANPMSGWTSVGNPFSDASAWDDQSFWSQCSGLVTTPTGEIIYTGTRQIYHWSAPHSLWKGLARAVMLPVTIAGDTMTIAWDPHWDPAGYE